MVAESFCKKELQSHPEVSFASIKSTFENDI
jgi:hypothetical protein